VSADRDHVRYVAQQSCLICGRRPSDAHHLRCAQSRALGRKGSDEFTVPLCRGPFFGPFQFSQNWSRSLRAIAIVQTGQASFKGGPRLRSTSMPRNFRRNFFAELSLPERHSDIAVEAELRRSACDAFRYKLLHQRSSSGSATEENQKSSGGKCQILVAHRPFRYR
jgi:hypothetical protein